MLITKCGILKEAWALGGHVVFEVDFLDMNSVNEVGCIKLIC